MNNKIMFALCGCLLWYSGISQTTTINDILKQIEQNNQELNALSELVKSKEFDLKSSNNLPDPQMGAYQLSSEGNASGDYTEYQISQSIEFPTVYGVRGRLIKTRTEELSLEFEMKRQEVLAQAKALLINLVFLQKKFLVESTRFKQAEQVYQQMQVLYQKEEIGIIEMNKAKVVWMQNQFELDQLSTEIKNLELELKNLNGGIDFQLALDDYGISKQIETKEAIWQEKQNQDPELRILKQQEVVAQQSLSLAKNELLPNLTLGYNSQGVSGERFSGVYTGMSIPLWSNRNKVKSAKSQLYFQESLSSSKTRELYASFEGLYNTYQTMFLKFQEYERVIANLNSDELLFKAYQLGDLSFMEYYLELQFFQNAYDEMLHMEQQLYISQVQLLKHQL